jgi:hypothetical protein
MNDGEIGDLILRQLYTVRQTDGFVRVPEDLNLPDIDSDIVINISSALGKRGLIRYHSTGPHKSGLAKILPRGIDEVEKPGLQIDPGQSLSVRGTQNVMSVRTSIGKKAENSSLQRFTEWVRKTIWSSGG